MKPPVTDPPSRQSLAPVLERNIRALIDRRAEENRRRRWQDKVADKITSFSGSMTFVIMHVFIFGAWIVWNLPSVPLPKFDSSLVILAMTASVESIFLSTFILITQNRITAQSEKRSELDLQISLLAEHEITRLVTLVTAIADKLGIEESRDPALDELKKDVAPEQVLDQIDDAYRKQES